MSDTAAVKNAQQKATLIKSLVVRSKQIKLPSERHTEMRVVKWAFKCYVHSDVSQASFKLGMISLSWKAQLMGNTKSSPWMPC